MSVFGDGKIPCGETTLSLGETSSTKNKPEAAELAGGSSRKKTQVNGILQVGPYIQKGVNPKMVVPNNHGFSC